MKHSILFFIFSLLVPLISANNIAFDYCVGDLSLPTNPSGYSCKDPANVSVDDFVYSGLSVASSTTNNFKFGVSAGFASQFPGLNGMDISTIRVDLEIGGVVPIHTHRVSELVILIQGTVVAGFIDTNNTAYYKTLNKGDMMIFPPGLLHFQVNVGSTPVVAYASFPSQNPGVQILSNSLFQNNLPSKIVEKITLLDNAQVKKLKKIFGGTS